jgi:hypothetical protein
VIASVTHRRALHYANRSARGHLHQHRGHRQPPETRQEAAPPFALTRRRASCCRQASDRTAAIPTQYRRHADVPSAAQDSVPTPGQPSFSVLTCEGVGQSPRYPLPPGPRRIRCAWVPSASATPRCK